VEDNPKYSSEREAAGSTEQSEPIPDKINVSLKSGEQQPQFLNITRSLTKNTSIEQSDIMKGAPSP